LPSELPAEEVPAAEPPGLNAEGPVLFERSDEGVRSASADAPAEKSGIEPSAFEPPQSAEPAGGRPVALEGFCLFELSANERWIEGDPKWSAAHHGRTYLFSSEQHRDRFLADPDRYGPAYAGYDPVLVVEGNRFIAGKTDFCVNYDGRLYVFSSAVTLARFQRDPTRYATP
jgi:YHS domain-containing protein